MATPRLIAPLALLLAASCSSQDAASRPRPGPQEGPLAVLWRLGVHPRAEALVAGDVDGDGHADVVVGGDAVQVLLGDGGGALRPAPGPPFRDLVQAADFALGDFDGDGRGDVAVAEHDGEPRFSVLLGQASGAFAPAPRSPFEVDATPHLHTLAAADFDGDGDLDVVTDSWPQSKLVVVLGRGDGSFETPGQPLPVPPVPMQNLRSGDLNGDGHPDVVTPAHDREAVTVLLGDGRGGLAAAAGSPFPSMGGFSTVSLGDMDRDGDLDVVEVHRSDRSTRYRQDGLSVLSNDGAARLSHAPGSPRLDLPERSNDLDLGDVDGDGWLDVATVGETQGVVALFLGRASGLQASGVSALPGRARGIALADLDGDGRAEVLVSDGPEGNLFALGLR